MNRELMIPVTFAKVELKERLNLGVIVLDLMRFKFMACRDG